MFDRLFGTGSAKDSDAARLKRDAYNKSILDFVNEEAKGLDAKLAAGDRRKIDEYFTAIREVEQRIERAREVKSSKTTFKPDMAAPAGIPKDYQEHIRLMCDLAVLSFQADLTRVVTLPFANDGSNRAYPFLSLEIAGKAETVRDGHHDLSHHAGDKVKHAKIRRINRFHVEQLAYFLGKLQSIKEGDKTLLDQSMIVYGSGIGDGNRHNHDDLPIVVAGAGGGKLAGGRHVKFPKDTPLMNLYLAMFERLGCPTKTFGDSTGVLPL